MPENDLEVTHELDGWCLFFALLERRRGGGSELDALRREVAAEVRRELVREQLARHPPIAAMRHLFKAAGCDPTRYRPSSEALLRRLLKGDELPAIHPLVDLNNCLSARLAAPCCVMAAGTFQPPFVWRRGREGESYESLRGPFRLENKPLLLDRLGPCDAPITGSQRAKVTAETTAATLVAYLPAEVLRAQEAERQLRDLLRRAPVATVVATTSSQSTT